MPEHVGTSPEDGGNKPDNIPKSDPSTNGHAGEVKEDEAGMAANGEPLLPQDTASKDPSTNGGSPSAGDKK